MSSPERRVRADALFREALGLRQIGQLEASLARCEEALALDSGHVQAALLHGLTALERGEPARALSTAEWLLRRDPREPRASYIRGHALLALGEPARAVESFDRVLALSEHFPDVHYRRANALLQLGNAEAALADYDRAIAREPRSGEVYNNRGNAQRALGRPEEALADYERALELLPQRAQVHFNRGIVLHELHRLAAALESFDRALALEPAYAEALCNRGNVLKDLERFEAALDSYGRAIEARPEYAEAHCNRGNVQRDLNQLETALACYERAVAIRGDYIDAYCNLGNLQRDLGKVEAALASFGRALSIDAEHAYAHFCRAFVHLVDGRFEEGWSDYEWRFRTRASRTFHSARAWPQARWSGNEPLAGRTIFITREQGLGDVLQFCRYVPMLARGGARVILEAPRPLVGLMRRLEGIAQVVAEGEPVPEFDRHCPIMSLPGAFATTLASVPADVPYLRADPARARHWAGELPPRVRPRVGLVWSGGFRAEQPELWAVNRRRNIPLDALALLKTVPVDFYSLQKGPEAEAELARLKRSGWAGPEIHDLAPALRDFDETAAIMQQLDLIISVDTAPAHLAGALGRPVWILNRYDTCWRWMRDRPDSPWYPTARLYRQERPEDWGPVIERLCADLHALANR